MSEKQHVFTYEGAAVDASWDNRLCIHVSECTRAKGGVFESGRDPWGDPDQAEVDVVVDVVERCPSGALTYARKDGGPAETPADENLVMVANSGPLYARGDLRIDGAPDDMPGVGFRAALCRCGLSKTKPFCDNSHEEGAFHDHGAIGEAGPGMDGSAGPLEISPSANGPYVIAGSVTLISGQGRRVWSGTKCALCRCGHSNNKPFCDGAHKRVGFTSD
jgi:CDGSH-type Zn-finger protein/uncharacterized Fe-S cluster protein YjdI